MECGWSVVQLDQNEEMRRMHWVYGTLDTELEAQRTIKRAELMAFSCLLWKTTGPTTDHVDNAGIIDGLCWSKSRGRRLVDSGLGGGAQESSRRNTAGGRARKSASFREKRETTLFEKLSPK